MKNPFVGRMHSVLSVGLKQPFVFELRNLKWCLYLFPSRTEALIFNVGKRCASMWIISHSGFWVRDVIYDPQVLCCVNLPWNAVQEKKLCFLFGCLYLKLSYSNIYQQMYFLWRKDNFLNKRKKRNTAVIVLSLNLQVEVITMNRFPRLATKMDSSSTTTTTWC